MFFFSSFKKKKIFSKEPKWSLDYIDSLPLATNSVGF